MRMNLHAEGIVLDVIKRASELDSLLEVNVERIVLSIVQLSHVNIVHFSTNDGKIFPLDKDSLLIDHRIAVDVDIVELDVGDPDLFVLFGREGVLLIVLFQVLELQILNEKLCNFFLTPSCNTSLIKPLNMNHEMDIKRSLHIINFKDLQDNERHVHIQQLLLAQLEGGWRPVRFASILPEVKEAAVVFVSLVLTISKIVADEL